VSVLTDAVAERADRAESARSGHVTHCAACSSRRTRDCATGAELEYEARRLRDQADQLHQADEASQVQDVIPGL
jgi:hypothetical protein